MDDKDLCEHTRIRLIAAALGHQQCTPTDGTEVLIPGTGKRILIGDDAYLARVALPAGEAGIDLDKLTRYGFGAFGRTETFEPLPDGEYVKLADVLALARRAPAPADERALIEAARMDIIGFLRASMDEDCANRVEEFMTAEVIAKNIGLAAHQAAPAQPALTVWYGPMPESNGKSNFTAVLMRNDSMWDGPHVTIERGEYPDRVRYEADRVRYLIGELADEPFILDYDADKHSGYVAAPAQPQGYLEDASLPKDMEQAVEWIIGLRNRVDNLLDCINSEAAPAQPSAAPDLMKELRNQMAYIAAYDPDELTGGDSPDGMRAADRLRSIIVRARRAIAAAQTSDQQAGAVALTEQQVADMLGNSDLITDRAHITLINGDPIHARLELLTRFANHVRSLAAPAAIEQAGARQDADLLRIVVEQQKARIAAAEARIAELEAVEQAGAQPVAQARTEDDLVSMDQLDAIRATITPGDGWSGDDWEFALANAVAYNVIRRAAPAPAADQDARAHVECRECNCGHVGINDSSDTLAACHNCDWSGPSPSEDHCPGCAHTNCMGAACPKCGALYRLLAEADITTPAAAPVTDQAAPKQENQQ